MIKKIIIITFSAIFLVASAFIGVGCSSRPDYSRHFGSGYINNLQSARYEAFFFRNVSECEEFDHFSLLFYNPSKPADTVVAFGLEDLSDNHIRFLEKENISANWDVFFDNYMLIISPTIMEGLASKHTIASVVYSQGTLAIFMQEIIFYRGMVFMAGVFMRFIIVLPRLSENLEILFLGADILTLCDCCGQFHV